MKQALSFDGFGARFDMVAPSNPETEAALKRFETVFQPVLGAIDLPQTGSALDLGADFGSFSLTFAARFPGWQVTCVEPRLIWREALRANLDDMSLSNVTIVEEIPRVAKFDIVKLTLPENEEAKVWPALPRLSRRVLFGRIHSPGDSARLFAEATPEEIWLTVRGSAHLRLRRNARSAQWRDDVLTLARGSDADTLNTAMDRSDALYVALADDAQPLLELARYTGAEVVCGTACDPIDIALRHAHWSDSARLGAPVLLRRDFMACHDLRFDPNAKVATAEDLIARSVDAVGDVMTFACSVSREATA